MKLSARFLKLTLWKLKEGDPRLAEELLQEVTKTELAMGMVANKRAAKAFRDLAAIAGLREPTRAIDAYKRSTDLEPTNAEGWLRLGELLLQLNRLEESARALSEATKLALDGKDPALLGETYRSVSALRLKEQNAKGAME